MKPVLILVAAIDALLAENGPSLEGYAPLRLAESAATCHQRFVWRQHGSLRKIHTEVGFPRCGIGWNDKSVRLCWQCGVVNYSGILHAGGRRLPGLCRAGACAGCDLARPAPL